MSKSNYEEVLENELNYEEVLYCTNHFIEDIKNETKLFIHHTRKALKKAQKQEKLLALYRKLSVIRNDLLSYCEVVDDDYIDVEHIEIDLEKKIKELENEKI